MGRDKKGKSGLFEIASLPMRFDHVARFIENTNQDFM